MSRFGGTASACHSALATFPTLPSALTTKRLTSIFIGFPCTQHGVPQVRVGRRERSEGSRLLPRQVLRRRFLRSRVFALLSRTHPSRRAISLHRDDAQGVASLRGRHFRWR